MEDLLSLTHAVHWHGEEDIELFSIIFDFLMIFLIHLCKSSDPLRDASYIQTPYVCITELLIETTVFV